ncbi:MAG: GNAT family N-acetyltransferase [Phenylobacterium sp.]|uniref:GNAT family N-acetyltransferase n=1 Tax=Phenylobacterium sp. TaxID=1871053 RepID=UPI00271A9309|nr:GNAT family N-acetyltransferase [Phenylobacterium sp.]MDO8911319.1 GNAT family N-acetyltransferase [Phenylobacterium sp.]
MGQVIVRRATLADATAIRDLTRAAYAKWVAVIGREPKPMGADYEAAVRAHRFDLLHAGSELAALIETVDAGDHLLIENVAVSPAHQGRGLGRLLLAHAAEIAVGLGYDRVALYTNQRFEANVALYLRVGYGVDREEPIGDGVVVHMSKALDA